MSNFTNFTKITFINGESGNTPLSASNLNDLQRNIENSFKYVFGSNALVTENNPDSQWRDGFYNISDDTNYPFEIPSLGAYGFLIVLVKTSNSYIQHGDRITQIAIDNNNNEVWIRCGRFNGSTSKIDTTGSSGHNWKKVESITQITENVINKTNIKVGDKYVYVKRLKVNALPNTSELAVATGISESVTPYKFEGMAYRSSDGVYLPIPYVSSGIPPLIGVNYNSINRTVNIITATDRSAMSGYVDFYFTYND